MRSAGEAYNTHTHARARTHTYIHTHTHTQTHCCHTHRRVEGDKAENQAQLDKIKAVQVTHHGNRHGRRRAEKAARAVVESNAGGFREATVPEIAEGRMIIAKCDRDAEKGAPFMVGKLKEACSPGESTPGHRAHHATSDAHNSPARQCTQTSAAVSCRQRRSGDERRPLGGLVCCNRAVSEEVGGAVPQRTR